MTRAPALALIAAVFAAAACSDRSVAPTGVASIGTRASVNDDAPGQDNSNARIAELNTPAARNGAGAGGNGASAGMVYHGGPVITAGITVSAIYWASSTIYPGGPAAGTTGSGAADGSVVGHFLRNLGGSPYYNINTTYTNGSGTKLANVVNYTNFWANNTNAPSNGQKVTDAQMLSMLQSGFVSGALTYDPNTLYTIFTAGTVNLGGGFGTQYCAYHYWGNVTIGGQTKTVIYAAMPYDAAYPGVCTNGTTSPNNDPGADAIVNTLAHEVEEAATDPRGTAWFDRRGYENADKCAWQWGTTYKTANGGTANMNLGGKDFLVQMNWVNAGNGGCAKSY